MPELPEVETIVRELDATVIGKTLAGVRIMDSGVLGKGSHAADELRRRKILNVRRRGKFIVFVLTGGKRLVVHLRMTGRLTWVPSEKRKRFVRAVLDFTDGASLNFSDVRKFGRIWISDERSFESVSGTARLGREPLDLTLREFEDVFRGRRGILKNTLLRQDVLAGIGNIYADEICFRSGLHPASGIGHLNRAHIRQIREAVRHCLKEGIRHCGVSVSDFAGTRGDLGKHQHYLWVYGRTGDPCRKCGTAVKKTIAAGRGTHFCQACQTLFK